MNDVTESQSDLADKVTDELEMPTLSNFLRYPIKVDSRSNGLTSVP